jgi:hypothetical protein
MDDLRVDDQQWILQEAQTLLVLCLHRKAAWNGRYSRAALIFAALRISFRMLTVSRETSQRLGPHAKHAA